MEGHDGFPDHPWRGTGLLTTHGGPWWYHSPPMELHSVIDRVLEGHKVTDHSREDLVVTDYPGRTYSSHGVPREDLGVIEYPGRTYNGYWVPREDLVVTDFLGRTYSGHCLPKARSLMVQNSLPCQDWHPVPVGADTLHRQARHPPQQASPAWARAGGITNGRITMSHKSISQAIKRNMTKAKHKIPQWWLKKA